MLEWEGKETARRPGHQEATGPRSGKLMRRVLKAVILDRDPGDITTIEDEGSVDEARQAWMEMKSDVQSQKPGPNV